MDLNLTEKVVCITGAARGIGRALALGFAAEGARVIGIDVLAPDDADGNNSLIEHHLASVTDRDRIQDLLAKTHKRTGGIHCLINNAALATHTVTTQFKRGEIADTLAVNLEAVFEISREYFRLQKRQGGNLINIASILGLVGAPLASLYGATKGGVVALTRHFAVEWARYGFRANAVCPGLVETAMTDRMRSNDKSLEANLNEIPLGRFAAPREIADLCLFLASERSAFITGQAIVIDGGYTAH